MKITGQIVKQKPPFAYVRSARPESCKHCSNSGICNKKDVEICAYNDIDADVGDYVTVETNEDKSAPLILAYLFLTPIGILFLSYFLYTIYPWLVLSAIPLIVVYYVILKKLNKNHPVRARIISKALSPMDCSDLIQNKGDAHEGRN